MRVWDALFIGFVAAADLVSRVFITLSSGYRVSSPPYPLAGLPATQQRTYRCVGAQAWPEPDAWAVKQRPGTRALAGPTGRPRDLKQAIPAIWPRWRPE